jgi:hypothetical protein
MADSPLFVKTYDLILWLMPATQKYPRHQRFVLAKRVQDAALDLYERLLEARKVDVDERRAVLRVADVELDKLRLYLRLSQELGYLSFGGYEHVSRMVVEVGRLLGAWRKKLDESALSSSPV